MNMIFVDAENIGLKELSKIEATIIDKVFVFTKSDSIAQFCEQNLYHCLSDYPSGANQADFYIIAYLSRILATLDRKKLASVKLKLYSNDLNLIAAFKFQCNLLGGTCDIIKTKNNTVVPIAAKTVSPSEQIYAQLHSPQALNQELQAKLGLSKSAFTRAVNELAKANKICRSPESKKKWVRR
ncbi:hypothetical protein DS2_15554 [Catenovulum agarivorans DS-2]|uniref:PIN-like domain-containing protein n=1 Tax=Catenovulum agarivorans DS-2 TaxID=1328313 RepID=W7QIQ8_9ALTE|nr:hypothetical protein [Catenovulum agarivorans]EWH08817.1 hypothetical protein DS2_15554 [Catenovulum agarivorans DS-2]